MNFHLFCNDHYVESFYTKGHGLEEQKRRSEKYPQNKYDLREGKFKVGHGVVTGNEQQQASTEE